MLELKAQVIKKKENLKKHDGGYNVIVGSLGFKGVVARDGTGITNKGGYVRNAGVEERANKDEREKLDEISLETVRKYNMERKAKLYEELERSRGDGINPENESELQREFIIQKVNFNTKIDILVNFQAKVPLIANEIVTDEKVSVKKNLIILEVGVRD